MHYDADEFPILSYDDPVAYVAYLWLKKIHNGDHRRIKGCSKVQEKIMDYPCRKTGLRDKVLAEQVMAPFEIKDTVKQRSRKKVWGLVLNCVVTRAVHLDITEDYGADAFLQTLRIFVSLCGCPAIIH